MDTLTTYTMTFTGEELKLLAEALGRFPNYTGRWREVANLAVAHPEFGLLSEDEEPVAEELR